MFSFVNTFGNIARPPVILEKRPKPSYVTRFRTRTTNHVVMQIDPEEWMSMWWMSYFVYHFLLLIGSVVKDYKVFVSYYALPFICTLSFSLYLFRARHYRNASYHRLPLKRGCGNECIYSCCAYYHNWAMLSVCQNLIIIIIIYLCG